MVDKQSSRSPGRPRSFEPEVALTKAVEQFWRNGYAATDLDTIAASVGVTKPSLYRAFGDKQALFMRALSHYGETIGGEPLRAFAAAERIDDAVRALLVVSLEGNTAPGLPSGCLFACVVAAEGETMPDVKSAYRTGLAATRSSIAARFAHAVTAGELPEDFQTEVRAGLLVDLMQALALRARSGEKASDLRDLIGTYCNIVLR